MTAYAPTRIAKGQPGYRLAAEIIANREISDIARVIPARWLDMSLEDRAGIEQVIQFETRLRAILEAPIPIEEATAMLDKINALRVECGFGVGEDSASRARYMLLERLKATVALWGRDEVQGYIDAYQPHASGLLAAFPEIGR